MSVSTPSERLHYMDHLRALAMLAGVFFHAALAYSPLMHAFFPTADRQNSTWVDSVVWGLHLVRMPLFFLIAGFFSALVISKRGLLGLFRQRLLRIALPLILFWPLVMWALQASTRWAAMNVEQPSALLVLVREFMQMANPPQLPPTTAHLWFLYYLLLFTMLHWVNRTLELDRHEQWLLRQSPAWLLSALPLLLVPALASVSSPHPAPESFLPQFWALVYYGFFFALGALLQGQPEWLARVRTCVPWLIVASMALYAVFLWCLFVELPGQKQLSASWLVATLEAFLSVWLTVLCLLLGQQLLNRPNVLLRYLAQGAYSIYLLHLPLLFALQYLLLDSPMAWPLKFVVACSCTLVLCLLSYQLLVRHTPLRHLVG